ncbi:MAG: response regulator transcription factor [Clostridia bacterium]
MKETVTILICDDDPIVHESLVIYLDAEGFQHLSAFDGEAGIKMVEEKKPDLLVLDLMLPQISGIEVCKSVRMHSKTPIIMLTAKGEEIDKILGLELGADDYIVKPFSPREVVARIKAVLRRIGEAREGGSTDTLHFPGLEISLELYQLKIFGQNIPCTPKEVEILYLLAAHPGIVFNREQILSKIWGYDYFGDTRTIDTHIKRIRAKLPETGTAWRLRTVYGVGYKFEAENG